MAIIDERGFWLDKKGEYIHPEFIRPDDELKDELVNDLVKRAKELQEKIKEFKEYAYSEIESYYQILLEKYNIDGKSKSMKGNLTLEDFAGLNKVSISISNKIEFNEKINIAKEKIDEYLNEITEDANSDVKTLINKAFEVDKKGYIDAKKILSLKTYDIQHGKWKEAMKIIDDAITIVSTKSYIRFYSKSDMGSKYENIVLDISKL